MTQQSSEVAQLRQRIAAEYEAAHRAMYEFADGVARHRFITARMENVDRCQEELSRCIGEQQAIEILTKIIDSYAKRHH
jgi:tRNA U34 5-carboxymethylaminomethyl modifying GTPase MnmE/TrmE